MLGGISLIGTVMYVMLRKPIVSADSETARLLTVRNTVAPSNTAVLGTGKKRRYSEMAVLGGSITSKNPIWDLKWAAVLGGRRYWEGRYWEGRLYHG